MDNRFQHIKQQAIDLADELGPIPTFPPRALDEHGRLIPISLEERKARSGAIIRTLKALAELPDEEPAVPNEVIWRGLDAERPPGQKLFEGLY
jgi:hypothetical protein